MCSVVCLSIFECKQPASVVYKVWVKCHFLFKNGTSRPSGTVNCGGTAGRSSERRFWLTWETQTVYVCGVYHWKSMKVQGVRSWTALYFVVRGHPVSLESFIFGRVTQCLWTKNEGPGTDDPFYSRLLSGPVWILIGKSYLHVFVFSFQEAFKNQNVVGFLGQSKVHLLSVCLIRAILPRTWVDKGTSVFGKL